MSAITPAHVRAGIQRELEFLATLGLVGPNAHRAAIAITRSKIMNSPLLVERQVNPMRCHVCGGSERSGDRLIPVLSGNPETSHLLHNGCHGEHVRRVEAKVDTVMAAAGYSADDLRGAA